MRFIRRILGEQEGPSESSRKVARIYTDLRGAIIKLDPGSVGIQPTPDAPNAWGVVMDWSVDRGVATIISLIDGTTSMYLSSGGGSIGAGGHEKAAVASIGAIRIAEGMIDAFLPVTDAPLPGPDRTALTVLTFGGLRRIEEANTAFAQGTSLYMPLANAMQEVVSAIRLAEAASERKH